ncbi:hypothetical protein AQS8620_00333 [Aquimixticola soesokkakensis]|uniref:Uncharacterized protein n=1 Tax=Aquimixticola soesokkakensis TaxID=1519096 RepID=A0A1Y5RG36_9RHOB|nr:DUF6478 family protein [Aquimixticola soesokkakensis]SLN16728.1 hypothetical protein AQS8620_00333 [Aquimixticola soesokkakensis]
MASRIGKNLRTRALKRATQRWSTLADDAPTMRMSMLRQLRNRARALRHQLDRFLFAADARLTLPMIGPNAIQTPLHTDWSYRPEVWRGPLAQQGLVAVRSRSQLGEEVVLHHDCKISELTLRQIRNTREDDLAPFGLRLDVFRFDGSFLALSIELPVDAVEGLQRRHILRLSCVAEMEKPLEIFARLNIRHGPNTEQVVRELPLSEDEVWVEFDLAYTKLNEKRVERMWVELILEGAEMNQIVLRDITLSRRPRAEL